MLSRCLSRSSTAFVGVSTGLRKFSSSILKESNINSQLVKAQYAVRGELVIKADDYRLKLQRHEKLPFEKIVACNIGNPHELGQQPITFFRQVLALCQYPALLDHPNAASIFPADAIARARKYLTAIGSGTGAYTNSKGLPVVREEVSRFIAQRDGSKDLTSVDNIFLTDGASAGVKMLLQTVIRNDKDGVLCPIPQYPLYSATLTLTGGELVGYFLDEDNGWKMKIPELEKSLAAAQKKGISVRGIVVINPGNPTGQTLDVQNMREIVEFCHRHSLVLMADEVYQTNIYTPTPFTSFKKVLSEMSDATIRKSVQLVSFHSVSKGFLGECGQRGGYFELTNIDDGVANQLYKLASISLCSNVTGQLTTGLMVQSPKEGDVSYAQYIGERDGILASLKRRALVVAKALNELEGVKCNVVEGALYAFPRITIPAKALEEAKKLGKAADAVYAMGLLDSTGICVVPGSGFGQLPNTFHFRTTILPKEADMAAVVEKMKTYHNAYLNKYR